MRSIGNYDFFPHLSLPAVYPFRMSVLVCLWGGEGREGKGRPRPLPCPGAVLRCAWWAGSPGTVCSWCPAAPGVWGRAGCTQPPARWGLAGGLLRLFSLGGLLPPSPRAFCGTAVRSAVSAPCSLPALLPQRRAVRWEGGAERSTAAVTMTAMTITTITTIIPGR